MTPELRDTLINLFAEGVSVPAIRETIFSEFGVEMTALELRRFRDEHAHSIGEQQKRLTAEAYEALSTEGLLRRVHALLSQKRDSVRLDHYTALLRFAHELAEKYYEREVKRKEEEEAMRQLLQELSGELKANKELIEKAEQTGLLNVPPEMKRFLNLVFEGD